MINLKNKNIIITGATGGIGNSIVDTLTSLNSKLIVTGTNEKKLEQLKNKNANLIVIKQDISIHDELEAFVEKCNNELDGKIDVLVNNAGITKDNLTIRMDKKEWDNVININLTSTFLLSKYVIKKMLKNKFGKIINITSVVGHTGNIGQANYAASKGGVSSMSKSLSLEYAKKNILINCIAPGFIETAMTEKINNDFKSQLKSKIPLDRFGSPQDIANCVAFLSSDLSNYTIHINGGMYFS
ncbi:3-oxoacyl-ACP reductase FabG [Candidatus Pelagibacter sp.]|nr:3-oxoacyl-ACP reductase FabG [Candidatus Pelagibacter sp.]